MNPAPVWPTWWILKLADFFRRAQQESRKGAEQGKELLASRLAS